MTAPPAESSPPRPESACPCGSLRTFAECCRAVLKRERPAADAEQLMRSRFTAHVVGDFEHLHRSFLETSREPYVPDPEAGGRSWTRLVIHSHESGVKPDSATVDFTAYFKEGETEQALHEKGEFRRVEGTWYYVRPIRQGPPPIKTTQAKVGRNDPCPCGSGKKYKQCCLRRSGPPQNH